MESSNRIGQALANINRNLTLIIRKNPRLRVIFPTSLLKFVTRARSNFSQSCAHLTPVLYRSSNTNIYHCCVQKTGSQWIQSLLSDIVTYQYSGLSVYAYHSKLYDGYDPRIITERSFPEPFPANRIICPLYIDYYNYKNIPKIGPHSTFFVMRDPRDILISWYFSVKYSHVPIGEIPRIRNALTKLSLADGIVYSMEHLDRFGLFAAMRSWKSAEREDPNIVLLRYEDLSASSFEFFTRLFSLLDIGIPEDVLLDLLEAYSFKRLTGRNLGTENLTSHIRSGGSGSWKKYFDARIESAFSELTDNLADYLGYR